MNSKSKYALVLFAKEPLMGKVKTRLSPFVGPETALELHIRFVKDSIEKICEVKNVDRFIGVYPSNRSGFFDQFAQGHNIQIFIQEGSDLGERMRNAIAQRFEEGYEKVVIIGSDSPTLPVSYIEKAFQSEKDVIIGPSSDSGYYLVGMNKKVTDIFTGVDWGSEKVLSQTLARVKAEGAGVEALPLWYDVDRPEDVVFLKTHLEFIEESGLNGARHTREFLKQLNIHIKE